MLYTHPLDYFIKFYPPPINLYIRLNKIFSIYIIKMVKEINIEQLLIEKQDILYKIKMVDKNISYNDFLKLKNEYAKIHNKIRYYNDEQFKKKSNEYSRKYSKKNI